MDFEARKFTPRARGRSFKCIDSVIIIIIIIIIIKLGHPDYWIKEANSERVCRYKAKQLSEWDGAVE